MPRSRREMLVLAAIALAVVAGIFAYRRFARPPWCELCERPIHPPTAFRARIGGRERWACCARCGLSLYAGAERVDGAVATDFPTGKGVAAESCAYVAGSDLAPCCSPAVIVTEEKAACGSCFDRCFPSIIAFAKREDALAFAREHGGRILTFEAMVEEARKP